MEYGCEFQKQAISPPVNRETIRFRELRTGRDTSVANKKFGVRSRSVVTL